MTIRPYVMAILATGSLGCGASTATNHKVVFADADDPAYAAQFNQPTDPRISSSAGEAAGIVVLWPRVVSAAGSDALKEQMGALQARLLQISQRAFPGAPIDVRPEPQRTCPKQGCAGVALGALVLHVGGGCAILALVSQPGPQQTFIVPWSGKVALKQKSVAFRKPPEDQVKIQDMIPCAEIFGTLDSNEPEVEKTVRTVKGSRE
jgi:hypothetical protein